MIKKLISHFQPISKIIATKKGELSICDLRAHSDFGATKTYYGRSLLIATRDTVKAINALILCDGFARRIGFCSPSLNIDDIYNIAKVGQFEAILADEDMENEIPAFASLHDVEQYFGQFETCEAPDYTDWVMTTSGTTGKPKLVSHNLQSSTKTTKKSDVPLQDIAWGLLYDYTRFAGMQVVLQALLSGSLLVEPDRNASMAEQVQFLIDHKVTHLSATPTLWRKILMTPDGDKIPLKIITLGGEIADQNVLDMLAKSYPDAKIIHIFASTEAGAGFSVKDGKAGFPADYLHNSPNGIALRIVEGILQVKNTNVVSKYLDSDDFLADEDGWVSTGDLVEQTGDRVKFLGRANGTINVGGNKVLPELVEAALTQHPQIASARVYARKSPFSGSLVCTDIMLVANVEDEKALKSDIRHFLSDKLEAYQSPAIIKIVDDFAVNAAGKVIRSSL